MKILKNKKIPLKKTSEYKLDILNVGECVEIDDYSRELMQRLGGLICSYKQTKKGKDKKFITRKIEGNKIGLWRIE